MNVNHFILTNATIYTEKSIISNGFIEIEEGRIKDIGLTDDLTYPNKEISRVCLSNKNKIIPGMIDVHIHGINGSDTMDATIKDLDIMASSLPMEGTTSFLATTMTQERTAIEAAIVNAANYMAEHQQPGKAEVLGIHLEGPFINKKMAGAQPKQYIICPDIELFKKWQRLAKNKICLVTLAPEEMDGMEFVSYLKQNNVIASIGHSNSTYEQVNKAIKKGLSHVTHLYNQMRGLHHRELGVVGAAFLRDELMVEIIADGIHSQKEAIQIAYSQKRADDLLLITDAIRAKCLKNGTYDLGGQQVTVDDGRATLINGTLAGSVLKMGQAFKNIIEITGCTVHDAIKMSSTNAAKELGIYDKKGSISIGKDADIVVLDEQNDVFMTFCRGKLAYNNGNNRTIQEGNH